MNRRVGDVGESGGERGGSRFLGAGGSLVGKDLLRNTLLHILVASEIADAEDSRRRFYEGVANRILAGVGSFLRRVLLHIFVAYGIAHQVGSRNILLGRSTSNRRTCFLKSDVRYRCYRGFLQAQNVDLTLHVANFLQCKTKFDLAGQSLELCRINTYRVDTQS